jgi:hypothetical protein
MRAVGDKQMSLIDDCESISTETSFLLAQRDARHVRTAEFYWDIFKNQSRDLSLSSRILIGLFYNLYPFIKKFPHLFYRIANSIKNQAKGKFIIP